MVTERVTLKDGNNIMGSAIRGAIWTLERAPHSDESTGCTTCCVIEDLKAALRDAKAGRD